MSITQAGGTVAVESGGTGVPGAEGSPEVASPSPWSVFLSRRSTRVFLAVIAGVALLCFLGPAILQRPQGTTIPILHAPGLDYPMGTDALGRDYLLRVISGGRISLIVGFAVAILCMTIGLIVGSIAGFYRGVVDSALVKVAEFFQVLPGLVLALVAAAFFGSSLLVIVVILSFTMWPAVARIVRAEAMRVSQLGYVEAAIAAGFSGPRIILSQVVPNALPPALVATSMTVGRAILIESGLAYLGVGDANNPSWGALLNSAQAHLRDGWWLPVFPGLLIFVCVLAVNILGDRMNDALNPALGRVK